MSRVCEITGKKVMVGNNVSHSQRKTKRRFYPNLQRKRFYIPEEDRWVTLRVSAKAIRTISKIGVVAAIVAALFNLDNAVAAIAGQTIAGSIATVDAPVHVSVILTLIANFTGICIPITTVKFKWEVPINGET